jgi:hypothetical protein
LRRNPWPFGGEACAPPCCYSCRHSRSPALHRGLPHGFLAQATLPYHAGSIEPASAASVPGLAPRDCRRGGTRPVSCYALFQGWLLLSQPPGCLSAPTSFHTQPGLGDLSWRSGLFPSRTWSLAPTPSLLPRSRGIRGLVGFGKREPPSPFSALPPRDALAALPLKAFRGEPAISGFVWHFTPTHSSSLTFEPVTGSALQARLGALQPGHG